MAPNIMLLRSPQIDVSYIVGGILDNMLLWLQAAPPLIVFVQAAELPHGRGAKCQHTLPAAGLESQELAIYDPGLDPSPVVVPLDDFLPAWDEMDGRCAIVVHKSRIS